MGKKILHFVAYHSTSLMGRTLVLKPSEFSWYSQKKRKFLEQTIGNKLWMIQGTKVDKQTKYELMGYYVPQSVNYVEGDTYAVRGGEGKIIDPPVAVDDYAWFQELLRTQNQFSFGLNRIQQDDIIAALENIAEPGRLG